VITIKVLDPAYTRIAVSRVEPRSLAVKTVPASKTIELPVDLGAAKMASYTIYGLADGFEDPKGEESFTVFRDGRVVSRLVDPTDLAEDGTDSDGGAPPALPGKKVVLVKPKPAVESTYDLEIKPDFDLTRARRYRITNRVGGHKLKPVEVAIQEDPDRPNKPESSQYVQVELAEGINNLTVTVLDKDGIEITDYQDTVKVDCDTPCETFGRSINTRAIVGVEQVGASSAAGKSQPFIDFFVNVPLGKNDSPKFSPPRVSIWTDFRLTSTTAQRFANLSNITTNILRPQANSEINDVVQSFRISAGFDIRLIPEKTIFPFFLPGKSSVGLIFGAGVTSPLTGGKSSVTEIFQIPKVNGQIIPEFSKLFPEIPNDKVNVGFVTPERDRFLRRWFIGGRLKTRFYKSRSYAMDMSPAMLDVTIGQDESITRKLSGKVLNFEGFTPFKIGRLDYIYLYGGITTRLTRKVVSNVPSFFLEPAEIADLVDPLKTYLISADENRLTVSNRDKYFFGIGIDLIRLFRGTTSSEPTEERPPK
jgi:hypothetical protein